MGVIFGVLPLKIRLIFLNIPQYFFLKVWTGQGGVYFLKIFCFYNAVLIYSVTISEQENN